jgi:glycosyltransferase involved in cell wall biosynthesis
MKILHIITGLGSGGAEGVLRQLVLTDHENEHAVVSLTSEGLHGAVLRAHGADVESLGMQRGRLSVGGILRLWRVVRRHRPDVIQTWMYHADLIGGWVSRMAVGAPVVWGLRSAFLDRRTASLGTRAVVRACAAMSYVLPARIVSCSASAARAHISRGYNRSAIVVVPNGYDVERLAPDRAARRRLREEWGVSDDTCLLGMVARSDPAKDHDTLFAALSQLLRTSSRAWTCVVVGEGLVPENCDVAARLQHYGIAGRVRLGGPRADIPAVMSALDVHVLSSRAEAFPNVLAEAMAAGTPCVSTNVGDAAYIIGDTGWLVPPGEPASVASALQEAVREQGLSERWSARRAAARDRIEAEFALAKMVDAYRELWREVAGSHAGASL